jgi:hypothetical protein
MASQAEDRRDGLGCGMSMRKAGQVVNVHLTTAPEHCTRPTQHLTLLHRANVRFASTAADLNLRSIVTPVLI